MSRAATPTTDIGSYERALMDFTNIAELSPDPAYNDHHIPDATSGNTLTSEMSSAVEEAHAPIADHSASAPEQTVKHLIVAPKYEAIVLSGDEEEEARKEDTSPGGKQKQDVEIQDAETIRTGSRPSPPTTPPSSSSTKRVNKSALPASKAKGDQPNISISRAFEVHYGFHSKVLNLVPKLSLGSKIFEWPERRYWIAVLIMDSKRRPNPAERDFVWMRGNRFSTVRTIWHQYNNTAFSETPDWRLLLGDEKVGMEVQAQEMDLFGDKLVVLRAVSRKHPDWKGRSLLHDISVVDLIDD